MNRLNKLFLAAVALIGLAACGTDHEDTLDNWKWDVAAPADANPELLEAGWTNVSADYGTLPAYVNVYSINKTTDGKAAIAYIAVADMSKAKFSVSGDIHWSEKAQGNGNEKLYTPTEFYNNNESPTVVINGGLFFESDGFYYSQPQPELLLGQLDRLLVPDHRPVLSGQAGRVPHHVDLLRQRR